MNELGPYAPDPAEAGWLRTYAERVNNIASIVVCWSITMFVAVPLVVVGGVIKGVGSLILLLALTTMRFSFWLRGLPFPPPGFEMHTGKHDNDQHDRRD